MRCCRGRVGVVRSLLRVDRSHLVQAGCSAPRDCEQNQAFGRRGWSSVLLAADGIAPNRNPNSATWSGSISIRRKIDQRLVREVIDA
jgi:hypothetical protein